MPVKSTLHDQHFAPCVFVGIGRSAPHTMSSCADLRAISRACWRQRSRKRNPTPAGGRLRRATARSPASTYSMATSHALRVTYSKEFSELDLTVLIGYDQGVDGYCSHTCRQLSAFFLITRRNCRAHPSFLHCVLVLVPRPKQVLRFSPLNQANWKHPKKFA